MMCDDHCEERLAFERLVSKVCSRLAQSDADGMDVNLNQALKEIGCFVGADRAYLFQFRNGHSRMDNTHEWRADGIEPQIDVLQDIVLDVELPWFAKQIQEGDVVHIPSVHDLPPEADRERRHFEEQSIQSLIVVPMRTSSRLVGFLGFDALKAARTWSEDDRLLLQFVADTMAGTLQRIQMEEKLRASEQRHRIMFEEAMNPIFLVNEHGIYIDANEAALRFMERRREDLIGKPVWDFSPPDAIEQQKREHAPFIGNRTLQTDYWIHGKIKTLLLNVIPMESDGKTVLVGVGQDITERRQAEEALRESHRSLQQKSALLQTVLDGIPDIIGIQNPDYTIREYNQAGYEALGMTREDVQGKLCYELLGRSEPCAGCASHKAVAGKRMAVVEHLIPELGRYYHCRSIPVLDENGEVELIVEQLQDLTDKKISEERLLESETNFRHFFESMTDLLVVATPEGRILFANQATRSKLGYSEDELAAMHLLDWHCPEDREEAEAIFAEMLRGERDHCPLPIMRKDGTMLPVETRIWLGKWSGQDCVFGVCKDLSAEQEAQHRFERIFRSNPSPMALSSIPDRRFMDVNDAFLATTGYRREEIIGRTIDELNLAADPRALDAAATDLQSKGRISNAELQVRRKDGTLRDGIFSGEVIHTQGQNCFLTVMVDITDRRKAERDLATSEQKYRRLVDNSPSVVYQFRMAPDGVFSFPFISDKVEAISGVSAEVARQDAMAALNVIPEESRPAFYQRIRESAANLSPYHDVFLIEKDGKRRWLEAKAVPEPQTDGSILWDGFFSDVTERVQMSQTLEDLLRRQRTLLDAIPDIVMEVDLDKRYRWANDAGLDFFGEDLVGKEASEYFVESKETYDRVAPLFSGAKDFVYVESWQLRRDGEVRLLAWTCRTMRDAAGKVTGALSSARDITEARRMEDQQRHSLGLITSLLNSIPDIVFYKNPQGVYLGCNAEFARHVGRTPDEIVGKTDYDLYEKSEADFYRKNDRLVFEQGKARTNEEWIHYPDGRRFLIETLKAPFRDRDGRIIGTLGVSRNITQQREMEAQLRLQSLVLDQIQDRVTVTDLDGVITYVNDVVVQTLGYSREELIGVSTNRYGEDPERGATQRQIVEETLAHGEWRGEVINLTADGREVILDCRTQIVRDEQGNKIALAGISTDITERKRHENEMRETGERAARQRKALSALTEQIPAPLGDPSPALRQLTEQCSEALQCDKVNIWLLSDDEREIHAIEQFDAGRGEHRKGVVQTTADYPAYWSALLQENYIIAHDARRDSRTVEFLDDLLIPLGITSMLDVGIVRDGRLAGVLCFEHTGPQRSWHSDEVAFANTTAALVSQILANADRQRAEDLVRQNQQLLQSILNSVPDMVSVQDQDMNILFSNWNGFAAVPEAQRMIGTKCYKTYRGYEDICPDCRATTVLKTNQPFQGEIKLSESLWVDLRVIPIGQSENDHVLFVEWVRDITERKRTEADRDRLMLAINQAAESIFITDTEGTIEYVNPAFEKITGYSRDEAIGQNPRLLKSGEQNDAFYHTMWCTLKQGKVWAGRLVNRKKDGSRFTEEAVISPVRDETGRTVNYVAVKRDISQELDIENQLRQAQKMEAVGQLAGGVAHDFNNLLQVILGYGDFALEMAPSTVSEPIKEILKAGERAKMLVSQLLAFSRRQVLDMQDLDLNETVLDMLKMLRRIIGEHIELTFHAGQNLAIIHADQGQVGQILTNLCVNARDAMPSGGSLTIETSNVCFDATDCKNNFHARPGPFVLLSVTDTGCGMDEATVEKIFEPFFTTKDVGEGTGLGLSTVYGLVKQHDGFIYVDSEVDKGTIFKIYLPQNEHNSQGMNKISYEHATGGTETILLAEDDEMVRRLSKSILEKAGYTVLSAANGEDALTIFREHADTIDLLLLDVMMPKMGGRAVYDNIRKQSPGIRTLFASGYSMKAIHTDFILDERFHLIQKPMKVKDLLRKVREVLDGPEGVRIDD